MTDRAIHLPDSEALPAVDIVESAPDSVIAVDATGSILFANRQVDKMFGYAPGELFGQPIESLLPERLRGVHVGHRTRYLLDQNTRPMGADLDLAGRRKDGTEFPVDISLSVIRTPGRVITVAHVRDVSDRKRAEAMYRGLLDTAPDAIIVRDVERRIAYWSAGAADTYGWTSQEALGRPIDELLNSTYPVPLPEIEEQVRDAGGWSGEIQQRCKDGRQVTVSSRWARQAAVGTRQMQFLEVNRDVTEAKKFQELLTQQSERLARSNRELEQFAYVASHDLQEPLRKVISFCQLLQRRYQGRLDDRADQYIGHAVDGASRMQELINDLLDYSRVGRLDSRFEPCDTGQACAAARDNLAYAIADAGASVSIGPLPVVTGEPIRLVQLFQNLISNAIKFHGDRPPQVTITAERVGHEWHFCVADNGMGIEPEYREKVFTMFQRLHSRDAYPGTGIGLSICKKIVEHHGGRIWLDSTVGGGTSVCWSMPIRKEVAS